MRCIVVRFYEIFRERRRDVGNRAHNMIYIQQLKIEISFIVRFVVSSQFLQNFRGLRPGHEGNTYKKILTGQHSSIRMTRPSALAI